MERLRGLLIIIVVLILVPLGSGCARYVSLDAQNTSRDYALYALRQSRERLFVIYVENRAPIDPVTFFHPEGGSVTVGPGGWYFFVTHHLPDEIAYQVTYGEGEIIRLKTNPLNTIQRGVPTNAKFWATVRRDIYDRGY